MFPNIKLKSDRYSQLLRELGNEALRKKNYFEALRFYNMVKYFLLKYFLILNNFITFEISKFISVTMLC